MEIEELYSLIKKLTEISQTTGYLNLINQIRTSLTQLKAQKNIAQTPQVQQQSNAHRANIENAKNQALVSLSEIQNKITDYDLVKSFNNLNIDNPFSEYARTLLNRITLELNSNIDTLSAEVAQYYQKLTAYNNFTNSINTVFGDVSQKEDTEENELIIFFEGGASIHDLKSLAKSSTDWNQIVNCFGRLVKDNNTDVAIV